VDVGEVAPMPLVLDETPDPDEPIIAPEESLL
jgi:hypothetical protein